MLKSVLLTLGALGAIALFAPYQERAPTKTTTPQASETAAQYQCAASLARKQADDVVRAAKEMAAKDPAKLTAEFMSVDAILTERREQERFRLQLAACFADPNDQSRALIFAAHVRSCLEHEETEGRPDDLEQ
jgi:hypothetical protein